MFLKYSFNFAVKCKSPLYSPIRNATFVRDVYKMINYTAPFSMSEKELVLKRLNSYTVTELGAHLTKVAAKRIIEHRESNGKFEQVEQLLDVDKIETVTLEKYCRILMQELSDMKSTGEGINKVLKYLDKDIKPAIRAYDPSSTILGLKVNVNSVSYALIDNKDLLDWDTLHLVDDKYAKINNNTLAHNTLFFKTQELVKQMPEADFCIQEEVLKVVARDPYMVLKFNKMKTKSYVDCILHLSGNIKSDVIHHMQPRVLDKVFELNIGNERISMSEKFPRIIQENYEEDSPFFLNISSQQNSKLKENSNREFVAGACLQALAFRLAAQTSLKKKKKKSKTEED